MLIEVGGEWIEAERKCGNSACFVCIEIESDGRMNLATSAATGPPAILVTTRYAARQESGAAFLIQFGWSPTVFLAFKEICICTITLSVAVIIVVMITYSQPVQFPPPVVKEACYEHGYCDSRADYLLHLYLSPPIEWK